MNEGNIWFTNIMTDLRILNCMWVENLVSSSSRYLRQIRVRRDLGNLGMEVTLKAFHRGKEGKLGGVLYGANSRTDRGREKPSEGSRANKS